MIFFAMYSLQIKENDEWMQMASLQSLLIDFTVFLLDVVNSSKISLIKDIWSIFIESIGAYRNQGDFTNNVS